MSRPRLVALLVAVALMLLVIAGMVISGGVIGRGWLCGFVLVAMVPIGSLALLLVHGISGGRWGHDLAPVLIPAARSLPLLLLAFLPVIVFRPAIYRWQALDLPPDVLNWYLNPLFFDLRTVLALAAWSALAWSGAWVKPLSAALGLAAHLVLMSLIPADWVLTLPPGSTSAGFGLGFGIEQMAAALAFAAVARPVGDPRADRDLAGLIVTTLLGTMYFIYMQFIVIWYGNVPSKVHWYAARATEWWPRLAFLAFLIGAALPFLALLSPLVRGRPGALRVVGGFVLCGVALHIAWLTGPAFGAAALVPGAVAALAIGLALAALATPPATIAKEAAQ